jgi:putative ABC transport system permease protein
MTRLYRTLLHLYPASWRAEYESELCTAFEQRRREARGPLSWIAVWLEAVADIVTNAPAVQFDVLRRDLQYAVRTLRHSPGFTIAAIGISALGIGATAAAYTMVDHILVRALPFPEQDRLLKVCEDHGGCSDSSPANYRDWKAQAASFQSMGAYRGLSVNVTGGTEPERIEGASVTGDLLPTLGVEPLLGRVFNQQDDRDGAPGTAVLSYAFWRRELGGETSVLGRTIRLDDQPYTVIGVMPRDFYFPNRTSQLLTAMRFDPQVFQDRTNTFIYTIGRLKPGVPAERAQAEVKAIAARIAHAYPKEMARMNLIARPLRDDFNARGRLMLNILMGAALCVLLVACTNVANLLLTRATARRKELAVRTALGAGRERLTRQMLTESLLLAAGGGILGLALAWIALPLLVKLVPVSLPIAELPQLNWRVLAFAAALTGATGIGFGVAPAIRAGRLDPAAGLDEGGRAGIGGRSERLRSALVVSEVAFSVVLLVAFGLLARALMRVQSVDPGFRADHVLTMRTSLPMPRYENVDTRERFYRRVLGEAQRLPGVTGAAYTSFIPVAFGGGIWPVEIEGHPEDVAQRRTVSLRYVTPGYFATMGIPLLSGRDVAMTDLSAAPYVALVSQSFARRYWPNEDPVGRRIEVGNNWRKIIGVVGDIRTRGLERNSEPQVYVSWQQAESVSTWYAPKDLVVRSSGDPAALAPALRRIIHEADSSQPISDVRTMEAVVEEDTATRRTQLAVLGAFGGIAFLLAGAGIYGLLSFSVSMRTREIGVRMALGARPRDIVGMTLWNGLKLAAVGIALGAVLALIVGRGLESILAGVKPDDWKTLGSACGLSVGMTCAGCLGPALRAVRIDAVRAIRGAN